MSLPSIYYLNFAWLRNVLIQHFEDDLASVEQREDNFSETDKNKTFVLKN